jgi:hypothetical protein
MDLNAIIERVGDTEVLSDDDTINAAFTARDALRELDQVSRIRALSWIAGALDIPVTITAGE